MNLSTDNTGTLQQKMPNRTETQEGSGHVFYGRYGFITERTPIAVPVVTLLSLASIVGTFGNILILLVSCSKKISSKVEAIFIINLALSDLYVTIVADPMSLVGR